MNRNINNIIMDLFILRFHSIVTHWWWLFTSVATVALGHADGGIAATQPRPTLQPTATPLTYKATWEKCLALVSVGFEPTTF